MLYVLCILFPPLALLLIGRPVKALLNLVLCLFIWIPGIIHAWFNVNDHYSKKRMEEQAKLNAKYEA
ncbi:YqaE/Pmp3 family membrane protein [Desertibacillus haloalkaliphilus]|uniref:YqaE/Pmp3 family membrane protein n=1 Tax=Desertibacillus haloalkaliphilus TaxID=1328930 RepID=UPI001C276165|nr:YqaE/Pmp3 family membrane protein [Desertibacillus haloalkaliphilus]MBU8908519.1 YqaE/Pmp3 family membrane protein [Desertibacillus haloalkaliphilus]